MSTPQDTSPRPYTSKAARVAYIIFVVIVLIFIGFDIGHAVTRTPSSDVNAAVATWTPSHVRFCNAVTALEQATYADGALTTKNEPAVLAAEERLAIYAPSKGAHDQFASTAKAFVALEGDPSGVRALNNNTASTDPVLKAFKAAVGASTSDPASQATATC